VKPSHLAAGASFGCAGFSSLETAKDRLHLPVPRALVIITSHKLD